MPAPRDFAGKKRKPGKSGATRRAPKKQPKPVPKKAKRPWLLMIVTLALVLAFGYFLYGLVDAPNPVANKPSAPVITPKAEPAPTVKSKPAPTVHAQDDKKRFEFYEALPKSEVITSDPSVYKSTPRDAIAEEAHDLQISSFKQSDAAEKMRAELILRGVPNMRTETVTNAQGTVWYRVVSGPYNNRRQLESALDKLTKLGHMPLKVKAKAE